MSGLKPMTSELREDYVRAAEWIAQGIGPCDVGNLPGEINSALAWLALDDTDPRKRKLDSETTLLPAVMRVAVEGLIGRVQATLEALLWGAFHDPKSWDVLDRIVHVAVLRDGGVNVPEGADVPKVHVELYSGTLPIEVAEPIVAIALDLGKGNIPRPKKNVGPSRGIRGLDDPSAQDKVGLNVETIDREMKRNGHGGGAYNSKASASEESRRRTAAGIVQDALERRGLKVSYARIVEAVKQFRRKTRENG